jgi:hypothetical protein
MVSDRMTRRSFAPLGVLVFLIVAQIGLARAAPPPPPPPGAKPAPTPVRPTAVKPTATTPSTSPPATPPPTTSAPPVVKPVTSGATPTPAKPVAPGASAAPAAPPAGTEPGKTATDVRKSEIYGERLDGLQTEVDDLKDRIARSRARLALLKETVLRGVLAGSRVVIAHRNLMGAGFRLTKIVIIVDGAQIFARTDDTGSLDSEDELLVYDGNLPPGPHSVTVELAYRGHGYGVFSYLSGYTFKSRSSHSLTAPENGAVKLTSVGFERGNLTTEMKDRPSVQWQELPLDAAGRPIATGRKRKKE